MNFHDKKDLLDRLALLIRLKATGDPQTLADKLGVSRRSVFNLLDELKTRGREIMYDRFRKTYKYLD